MKRLSVYVENKKLVLSNDKEMEVLFDQNEYDDVLKNLNTGKYPFFNIINDKYGVNNEKQIIEQFLYLYNFILMNNIANYIIDKYHMDGYSELIFDEAIKENSTNIIKLSGKLNINDALGDVIICLINSEDYLNGEVKIDYGTVEKLKNTKVESKGIEFFFYYIPDRLSKIRKRIEEDLIAFKYVNQNNINSNERYNLPIYIDENSLIKKGIENIEEYSIIWSSLAYLKMLKTIHDFFIDYYKTKDKKGLENDDIMLSLVSLLDGEIMPYPVGLTKSIEKGRETKGKCYFIETVVTPVALSQDLALILQAKDAYNVTPKIFRSVKKKE